MPSGSERFSVADLYALSELVATAWLSAADRDWSARAGTLEWSCTRTADHAVDCVWAPAFFLASRKRDGYPDVGLDMGLGADAEPGRLVQSLEMATRVLGAVVHDADPGVRAILFRRPEIMIAPPEDFPPRAATELILHAHDVCSGLRGPVRAARRALPPAARPHPGVADVDRRLGRAREHRRPLGRSAGGLRPRTAVAQPAGSA